MKLGIIGGGAWGSALASSFAVNFEKVIVYAIEEEVVNAINTIHENTLYLKGIKLNSKIKATSSFEDLFDCDILFITTPTQFIRKTISKFQGINKNSFLLICSKGIEIKTKKLISDVVEEELPHMGNNIGVLTGPTFAFEATKFLPMTLLLVCKDINQSKQISHILTTENIRTYYGDDIIGAQIGGAIKNVIAIASGIVKGGNLGHNALAGLITRGLKEMLTLNNYFGGRKDTIFGLSGLGDLTLTATSELSRNFSLGYAIGQQGYYDESIVSKLKGKGISEGFFTVKVLYDILKENNLDMPITNEVFLICYKGKHIKLAIKDLMTRNIKLESF